MKENAIPIVVVYNTVHCTRFLIIATDFLRLSLFYTFQFILDLGQFVSSVEAV